MIGSRIYLSKTNNDYSLGFIQNGRAPRSSTIVMAAANDDQMPSQEPNKYYGISEGNKNQRV